MIVGIYVTFSSEQEAKRIAEELLNRRLVACANIFAPHRSLYWWQGEINSSEEVAALFKTRRELFSQVEETVKSLHSYECPCVVSWDIGQGHAPFLDWIKTETA